MPEATERFLSDGLGLVGLVRADGLRGQAWGDEAGRQGALQHAHVIGQQGLGESRRGSAPLAGACTSRLNRRLPFWEQPAPALADWEEI
jgi:hypothetical protein